jgi:hypothetical protein
MDNLWKNAIKIAKFQETLRNSYRKRPYVNTIVKGETKDLMQNGFLKACGKPVYIVD